MVTRVRPNGAIIRLRARSACEGVAALAPPLVEKCALPDAPMGIPLGRVKGRGPGGGGGEVFWLNFFFRRFGVIGGEQMGALHNDRADHSFAPTLASTKRAEFDRQAGTFESRGAGLANSAQRVHAREAKRTSRFPLDSHHAIDDRVKRERASALTS